VTSGPAEQFGAHETGTEQVADDGSAGGHLEPPCTGDDAVDAAMQRLAGISGRPLDDQLAEYDAVHRTLQDRLADVEG
jgi:hypothetical protein